MNRNLWTSADTFGIVLWHGLNTDSHRSQVFNRAQVSPSTHTITPSLTTEQMNILTHHHITLFTDTLLIHDCSTNQTPTSPCVLSPHGALQYEQYVCTFGQFDVETAPHSCVQYNSAVLVVSSWCCCVKWTQLLHLMEQESDCLSYEHKTYFYNHCLVHSTIKTYAECTISVLLIGLELITVYQLHKFKSEQLKNQTLLTSY